MQTRTKEIKFQTQIKNLVKQAIKQSRDENNGIFEVGVFLLDSAIVQFWNVEGTIHCLVYHSCIGNWQCSVELKKKTTSIFGLIQLKQVLR